ncbi:lipopolysaccharide biosynthesis protein [Stutzerimonas nitrititolerans]|uniref:lipopolysaccharide biosynthesis protein n=1 Tax=Stutzerimonas nitrititolerans TaxID=2482751 RepID=UPI00289A1B13|nr:oligosaccharide flippase family protein [Stutzerimonas nitrititolerans]
MLKGPIALATIRTSAVLGLRLFVQAGTLLLVARMLGPEQFGGFVGISAIAIMLGSLSTLGMHLVLLRDVSRSAAGSSAIRSVVLQTALPMTLICGCLLFFVYLAIAGGISAALILPTGGLVAIGASEILLLPLLALQAAVLHGRGQVAASQMLMMLPLALRLLVAVCISIVSVDDALSAYAYGYLSVSVVALAASFFALREPWPSIMTWRLPGRDMLVASGGFAAINFSRLAPLELDKALAGKLLPLETAGLYSAASRVVAAVTLPITAMNMSALPRLFREEGCHSQRTPKLLAIMYVAALVFGVLLSVGLWLAAPVFPWLFSSAYQGIEDVVKLLCFAIPGMTLRAVSGNVLMALGKPWWRIAFEVCGMAVLAVTAIVLIDRSSANGMAIALICSEWSMAAGGGTLLVVHLRRARKETSRAPSCA